MWDKLVEKSEDHLESARATVSYGLDGGKCKNLLRLLFTGNTISSSVTRAVATGNGSAELLGIKYDTKIYKQFPARWRPRL